jgi:bifunctional polynucleotide phosphatase/kinase
MKQLNIPLSVYAATEHDEYRKPRAGMWREFLDDYDFDVTGIDSSQSIFVGDAAGRPGDHSAADW